MATAYSASFGGCGTLIGTGTNLTFKGIYEQAFPNAPGIDFPRFMFYNVPVMLIHTCLTWIWLQFLYMGLFRTNSKAAKEAHLGKKGEEITNTIIAERCSALGPISTHEISVAILFFIAILGWFFRDPGFITGWAKLITDTKIEDSTPAIFSVVLMFILPSKWSILNWFSSTECL